MSKIFIFFLLLCVLFFSFNSNAQLTNVGQPQSWAIKTDLPTIDYHLLPSFDKEKQDKIDAINDANGMQPWQFGYEHNVDFNLQNSGTWINLDNGDRIWQIEFESKGAITMNLLFDNFYLPEGATIYLYNPKTREYQGAYTSKNNNPDRMLGTTLIQGDNIVVEYYEPKNKFGLGELNISMVIHGYRSLGSYPKDKLMKGLNDAGACNHDVLCPLGIGWENQINSVAMIIVGGSGSCTGVLVNNTSNDGTPYFLSANHCGTSGLGNWVFRFNWDSPIPVCAQNANSQDPGAPYNEINGATLRANNSGTDFCLMELNSTPMGNIYYAGWDRSPTPATQATGIHHPRGDVKKICRENDPLTAISFGSISAWEVADWDEGVTEPASSGSPLFNQNQLLIGQLYGGSAACNGTTDNNQDDNYGRFDMSWDGSSSSNRLRDWLDPSNTNAMSHIGYNPNGPGIPLDAGVAYVFGIDENYCNVDTFIPEVTIRNYGNDTLVSVDILYNIDGNSTTTYSWNGSLEPSGLTSVILPTITATAGAHTFNVSTTLPNGQLDSNAVNDARSVAFFITLGGEEIDYEIATDCFGSEITWELTDSLGSILFYSGGPYNDSWGSTDTFRYEFCLAQGCYRFVIYDSYGDGLDGTTSSWCNRSGDYFIQDSQLNDLVTMTAVNGNFGDSAVHYFCLPFVGLGQEVISNNDHQFQVYPNPSTGKVNVILSFDEKHNMGLELFSAAGHLLKVFEIDSIENESFQIDLSDLSSGMYFLKLRFSDKIYAKKIVKD